MRRYQPNFVSFPAFSWNSFLGQICHFTNSAPRLSLYLHPMLFIRWDKEILSSTTATMVDEAVMCSSGAVKLPLKNLLVCLLAKLFVAWFALLILLLCFLIVM